MDADSLIRREHLARVGALLFGEDWQRPMARLLGPHHPDGARDRIDDRLVRRWCSGDRPIPAWVVTALPTVLREQAQVRREVGRQLEVVAAEMEAAV